MLKIFSHGISDVGLKRSNNEDAFAVEPVRGYYAVADGMGGAAAGEVASRIFIDTIQEVFSARLSAAPPMDSLREVFGAANASIISEVHEHEELQGMGCTAELITFHDEDYYLGHVGDSRTYVYRNGQLRQITRDHSFVQDQVDKGVITKDEARNHSFKNVILRAVGVNENLAVDLIKGKVLDGDLFLLCTDGLTDMVEDALIHDALGLPHDLQGKGEKLIQLAKQAGGKDNITVVLCQVTLY
jgi:PPM family protein phosphatase